MDTLLVVGQVVGIVAISVVGLVKLAQRLEEVSRELEEDHTKEEVKETEDLYLSNSKDWMFWGE